MPAADGTNRLVQRTIFSLIAFGIAFGYLEAAVVVYLRVIGHTVRTTAGIAPDALFPLVRIEQIGSYMRIVKIEAGREAATILMLVTIALAAARNVQTWLAAFALVFGVWDLVFYASLRMLTGWPSSFCRIGTFFFLLPVPWTGPVLAPSIVAATLVAGGILALLPAASARRPDHLAAASGRRRGGIRLLHLGMAGRRCGTLMPQNFPWSIFAAGELLAIIGFARGMKVRA